MTPGPLTSDEATSPQPSGAAQVPPFAAMLRATVLPIVATAPVVVVAFWIAKGTRGGLAALLGVAIAVAFFAGGLYVMGRVVKVNPMLVLAGALAVYLGQVLFLGVVILSLSGASWLDGTSFGLSVLAVALIWQLSQVVAFVRMRNPVYDNPAEMHDKSVETAGVPADEPAELSASEPATERLI
jgi:ATP synthase protein I